MKIKDFQLIKAGPEDLDHLRQISITTFSETFNEFNTHENMMAYINENLSESQLAYELNNTAACFYFVFSNHNLAGYMKLNFGKEHEQRLGEAAAELERFYVLKKFQKKGLGKFLLDRAIQFVKLNQLNCLWLGVWEHNQNAINFYRKYGFTEFGHHLFRLGNDDQKDLLMKLQLS